jgi:hypothetical protein
MKTYVQWLLAGAGAFIVAGLGAFHSWSRVVAAPSHSLGQITMPADARITWLTARYAAKQHVVAELTAGRMSLLEAAAAFREVDAQNADYRILDAFPGAVSEDEAYCRSVIAYVSVSASRDQTADLVNALKEEMVARLQDGALRLPGGRADSVAARAGSLDDAADDSAAPAE